MNDMELVKLAVDIKEKSYSPYSQFRVGAVVVTGNEKIYTGVNIENATYGATNCAERTAVFKAVSEGERSIVTIAIASDSSDFIYPCGICRQVLAEFGNEKTRVICSRKNGDYKVYTLDKLIPNVFRLNPNE